MIYRALSQTSYQFTTTTAINGEAGIDNLVVANLPRIKVINTDTNTTFFEPLVPMGTGTSTTSYGFAQDAKTFSSTTSSSTVLTNIKSVCAAPLEASSVVIDGETYYGYTNSHYGFCEIVNANETSHSIRVLAATYKVVRYDFYSGTIITDTYQSNNFTPTNVSPSSGSICVRKILLSTKKATNDLILGIYVEYPEE